MERVLICLPGASTHNLLRLPALDATGIYWAPQPGGIVRVSKSGGAPIPLWPPGTNVVALAVDQTRVYWSEQLPGAVRSIAKP